MEGAAAQVVIHEDGRIEYPPSVGGSTVMRGRIGSGKGRVLDVREKRVRRRDRDDREEIETRIIDHVARIWIEEWRDAETGEVTYWRRRSLDDQSHHGASGKSGWQRKQVTPEQTDPAALEKALAEIRARLIRGGHLPDNAD